MTQQEYMQILFNDCAFTIKSRNIWLSTKFQRDIKYLDQLTTIEASEVIDKLKIIKKGFDEPMED